MDPNIQTIFIILRIAVIIGLVIGLILYIRQQKRPENRVQYLIIFVEILIVISFISLLIFWDPSWATIFLTMGLLIVTLGYTISNQMNVDLIKNERKSRIYKDMALTIYSPIHFLMKETNINLQTGYVFVKWINNQLVPSEERIWIIQSPNDLLNKQVHDPDKVLSKYFHEIKKICDEYDEVSKELELLLKKIDEKRKNIWEQFETFCRNLKKDPLNFQQGHLESIFGLIISNKIDLKRYPNLKRYQGFSFFEENREILLSKLHQMSFNENIEEYQRIKALFISLEEKYDAIMKCLLIDWQKEYDLIEPDVMAKSLFGFD
jgi:Ca2+/Na+ antiporter